MRADDRYHSDAVRAEVRLRSEREQLWTIDPVVTEIWQLLRRHFSAAECDRHVRDLLDGGLQREPVSADHYRSAWELAAAFPDQSFSLTDRQSFSAIERSGHLRAWSYDDDFVVVRLGPSRNRAIEVVR